MSLKFSERRKKLKLAKEPHIAIARKWNKAAKLAKAGIIGAAVLPKALLIAAGYAGAKSANKKDKEPKKYMAG